MADRTDTKIRTGAESSDETDREEQVVLVTGAASGIGAAVARGCADRDWQVYATDIDSSFPDDVSERCRCRRLDVTDAEQCQRVVDDILAETRRIDALVNNAGYAVLGPVEDVDPTAARRQFDVLVHGVATLCRAVLPSMRAAGTGRIVNVSSVLGHSAYPGMGTYCAGKAALEALTDSLRMELHGTGVDAVLVEPAWVDTDFAETARTELGEDRTADYDGTYAALEDGWMLDGGPLATDPETVSAAVVGALTAPSPKARYPVGRFARFVRWAHFLPAGIQDPIRRVMGRASVTVRRVSEFVTGER
ncbi:SDR family oxidoreductase [Salinibaculum salinum]|uniref:SDR family oxidoreductase n=1 Tax=Salinibaculum salinum TaxID=3131996 RepID=UPI0030EEBBA9